MLGVNLLVRLLYIQMKPKFAFSAAETSEEKELAATHLDAHVWFSIPDYMRGDDSPKDHGYSMSFMKYHGEREEYALIGINNIFCNDCFDIFPHALNYIQANYDELIRLAKEAEPIALRT